MIQTYQLHGESQYYELSFDKNKTVLMRVRTTSILCIPQITRKRAKFWNRVYVNLSFILTSHIIIQSHDTHVSHFIYYEKQK